MHLSGTYQPLSRNLPPPTPAQKTYHPLPNYKCHLNKRILKISHLINVSLITSTNLPISMKPPSSVSALSLVVRLTVTPPCLNKGNLLLLRLSFLFCLARTVPYSDPMDCSTSGLPVHHQLPELAQTNVHHIGDAIQSSHPLSSPSPPTFSLSQHQGLSFASGGQSIGVSASASVLPMNIQGLISFRMDWLDFLLVQGTLKSLLQHHNSKA